MTETAAPSKERKIFDTTRAADQVGSVMANLQGRSLIDD
jgi:hypothetical protein